MEEVRVASWSELQEHLYADAWKESLQRFRSNYAFRGMSDARNDLRVSLTSLGAGYEQREIPLLRTFHRYARRYLELDDNTWNWLAVAQHYGLPTRLLDWSFSPLVALHFATNNVAHFDRDGVIWMVDYVEAAEYLPDQLRAVLEEESARVFTAEMLRRGADTLQELETLSSDPFVVFLEPPSLDDRIVNQYALFSLMSQPSARLDTWLAEIPQLARRITLPAELKWEIRDKLDQANITERVLFPGLDGLSQWLRRYYTVKQG